MTFFLYLFFILFILVCVFLVLLVLIQKGRGGGLASAFGGGGGNTAFGSKTGDVLTWATSVVFGVFILLAVVLNLAANKMATQRSTLVAPATPAAGMPADASAPGASTPAAPSGGTEVPVPATPAPA